MPSGRKRYFRKRYKRYKKKRSYRRKMAGKMSFRGARKMRGHTKWKTGPPAVMPVKLVYCQTDNLEDAGGFPLSIFFSLNSLFDPVLSGLGAAHQPFGLDQLVGIEGLDLFQRYSVKAAKVRVRLTNQETAGDRQIFVAMGCVNQNTTSPYSTQSSFEEAPQYTTRVAGLANGPGNTVILKNYYKMKNHVVTGYDEANNTGTNLANPATLVNLHLWIAPATAVTAWSAHVQTKITFYAILRRNNAINAS